MPVMERGNLAIHYETKGSGFPLLLFPPGGMNATIERWGSSAFNPMEVFSHDFWTITLDQRNAGHSRGPLDLADPWGSYAQDHLNLMNHLGIERFHVLGCCIGCAYVLKLLECAPDRVASAVVEPAHDPEIAESVEAQVRRGRPRRHAADDGAGVVPDADAGIAPQGVVEGAERELTESIEPPAGHPRHVDVRDRSRGPHDRSRQRGAEPFKHACVELCG